MVGAEGTTALRVGLSALILLGLWRPWRWHLTVRDIGTLVLYGLALGSMNLLFYLSLRTIPLGVALAIEFVGPLTVAIFTSRKAIDYVWIALSGLGLFLLLPLGGATRVIEPVGAAYAAAAAACWALYIVFGHRAGRIHGGQAVSVGMTVAAITVLPFGIMHSGATLLTPAILLSGLGVAILSSALPYSLKMVALRGLPKQAFGVLLSSEPAIGALAGLVLLDECLSLIEWAAIGCIVMASIGVTLSQAHRSKDLQVDHREQAD